MAKIIIAKKDLIWSYIGNFFRLAANILLLPFMLHYLSDEDLGMWYVFAGIAQFVVLLDFGFAPALSRNIAYVWCGAKNLKKNDVSIYIENATDFQTFKIILDTCRYIYLSLSIVSFVLLATLGTVYVFSLTAISNNVGYSWCIYGLGVVLNLYYSYFTSFLRGVGAIAENNIASIYSKLVQILFSCVLLYFGYGLLGVSIGYFVSGLVLRFYSKYLFYKYEGIGNSIRNVGTICKLKDCWNLFVVIWHNAFRDGLVTLSNYLSSQANTLICSSILGLTTTGSYGISVQLATIVTGMANIPYSTFQPKMQEKILKNEKMESLKLFAGSILLFVIMFFVLSFLSVLSVPIIKWFKSSFELSCWVLITIFLFMFVNKLYHLFASYISNFNRIPYTFSFVISSVISVLLSFLMAKYTNMGIWALVVAPFFVAIAYNAWKWPNYVLKDNKVSVVEFIIMGISFLEEMYLKKRAPNRGL